jgi:quinol monooxygenase YgiN
MSELIIHGRLPAKPDMRDQLVAQLVRAAAMMQSEAGCRLYVVSTADDDLEGVYVTEIWTSPEDHAASLKRDDVRALISETMPLVGGAPSGKRTRAEGGKGLDRAT